MPAGYKKALEERIASCTLVIHQTTMNPNATTLSGSPNDHPPPPADSSGANPIKAMVVALDLARMSKLGRCLDTTLRTKSPAIDPRLLNPEEPPAKRLRAGNGNGPRHRKIVIEDPLESVKESITAPMLSAFLFSWLQHGTAVAAADPTSSADKFKEARDAATDIIEHIEQFSTTSGFSHEQLQWNIKNNGGHVKVSHITGLHEWLVIAGLLVGDLQQKPPPVAKKTKQAAMSVRIVHKGKTTTMTRTMLLEARLEAEKYPGCVEAGMEVITEVLKNRSGFEKCITCDSGPRGKSLDNRPIPAKEDHPYLAGCKCPLRGAALELWMIKMTAGLEGIPQRGDGTKNSRLALNPDILKIIAGAIETASGLDVDQLLQPEIDRLEQTIHWALKRLETITEDYNSRYSASFHLLSLKLKETMKAFYEEDNEDDDDDGKNEGEDEE
ncbi:hypothetical protein B0H19DRAFT_1076999 [Mycena capillaripes]|nr:hypothetical protein B0H19DRAFT_1076999 [Mycena capillaripes]